MYCPACGEDAGDDGRCPSCDADLSVFREAAADIAAGTDGERRTSATSDRRGTKPVAGRGHAQAAGNSGDRRRRPSVRAAAPDDGRLALRRWLPWTIAALVVVVAVVVVVVGPGGDATSPTSQSGGDVDGAAEAPAADTSGTYDELVRRADTLYDNGARLFEDGRADEAAREFAAAATVYEAAWNKQPGDPNVGTDWATSLFYSGDIDAAIARVDAVLAENPEFQPGLYNRGNYLVHAARVLDAEGDSSGAAEARAQAEAAFRAATAVDAGSDVGKAAAERLKSLESEQ